MKLRGKSRRAAALSEKASEVRESAGAAADVGGDALKDFFTVSGGAAREFAHALAAAAKELIETTEKAAGQLNGARKPRKGRLRRLFKAAVVLGGGAALVANERVRNEAQSQIRKLRGQEQVQPWTSSGPSTQSDRQDQPTGVSS